MSEEYFATFSCQTILSFAWLISVYANSTDTHRHIETHKLPVARIQEPWWCIFRISPSLKVEQCFTYVRKHIQTVMIIHTWPLAEMLNRICTYLLTSADVFGCWHKTFVRGCMHTYIREYNAQYWIHWENTQISARIRMLESRNNCLPFFKDLWL